MLPLCTVIILSITLGITCGETLTNSSTLNNTDLNVNAETFLGHSCSSAIECAENLQCMESLCQCSESEYWGNSRCSLRKSINDAFMEGGECRTTLYSARGVCQCVSSDYWTESTCSLKKHENSSCKSPLECKSTLQCRNYLCLLSRGLLEWTVLKKYHSQCHESVQCQDTLQCISGTCQCDVMEYWTQTAYVKSIVSLYFTNTSIHHYLFDYEFMVPTDFDSSINIRVPTNAVDGFV
ncbi:unnamed protein product [Mytilus coruscus]|uniref:EB domain-containing protein n=1 Tax=Mytilus coruscus TaxID=42192 RepID=A0A6J8F1K0_MYTCO|nr:unnamed protein product [Mytilus coruscus]